MTFDPDKVSNKDFYDNIKDEISCSICLLIAKEPKQCDKCQNIFCSHCITDWLRKKNSCPLKCSNFKIEEVGRVIRNMLSKVDFYCDVCEKNINYERYLNHIANCKPIEKVNCPVCNCQEIESTKVLQYKEAIKEEVSEAFKMENKKLKDQINSLESIIKCLETELLKKNKEERKHSNSHYNNFDENFIDSNNDESNKKSSLLQEEGINNSGFSKSKIYIESKILEPGIEAKTGKAKIISFDFSGVYEFKNRIAGTNNVGDLEDETRTKGICANTPGYIIFELDNIYVISSIQIGGYKGDSTLWYPMNGASASILVSKDRMKWEEVGKVNSKFCNNIISQNLKSEEGKYIKLQGRSYVGVGYFTVNDPKNYENINEPNNNIKSNSNIMPLSESSKNENSKLKILESSEKYYFKNQLIGDDSIESLLNKDLSQGLCLTSPGKITFKYSYTISSSKLEIGGYNGNKVAWYPENGSSAKIEISMNGSTWTHVGKIPSGFGKEIKTLNFNGGRQSFQFIRLSHTSYLGISYFNIIEDGVVNYGVSNNLYNSVTVKNKYVFKGKTAGTNNVEDLLDNNPLTGVCSNSPGEIIINLKNETTLNKIEVCGWAGDKLLWATQNGSRGKIETSMDSSKWILIGNLPSLTNSIVTIDVNESTAKYIRITSNSYLGLGCFRVLSKNEKSSSSVIPKSYTINNPFKEKMNITDCALLGNKQNQSGICTGNPGVITFTLPKETKFSKIECRGYTGDSRAWHPTQGMNSSVYTSLDMRKWTLVGTIPKTFGSQVINFNVISTSALYIKIESYGYLGLSYFVVME